MNEKVKKIIKEIYPYVICIVVVLLFKEFLYAPIRVNGESMNPTLKDKDIMILNKIDYRFNDIKRFDIVVVDNPDEYLIKRVIGLPGDKIVYKNNKLYVNGKYIKENFKHEKTEDFKYNVPNNKYYVMGDNRINSLDSRYFGPFLKNKIIGKASTTILPIKRFGNKK